MFAVFCKGIQHLWTELTCNQNKVQDSRADGGLGQHYQGAE